jgi:hypothetical protein
MTVKCAGDLALTQRLKRIAQQVNRRARSTKTKSQRSEVLCAAGPSAMFQNARHSTCYREVVDDEVALRFPLPE